MWREKWGPPTFVRTMISLVAYIVGHIVQCILIAWGQGGSPTKIEWGCVRPASQNSYPKTKISDIPHPIYDLIKNLKPYL